MLSRISKVAAAFSIIGLSAVPAFATVLSASEIKTLIGGKKVYLSTPYGLEFPLHYQADGSVTGDASRFTLASMITPKETGSWWTQGQKLCQKWPTWYDGKTICFTIKQTGPKTISWTRDDGMKGTARIKG